MQDRAPERAIAVSDRSTQAKCVSPAGIHSHSSPDKENQSLNLAKVEEDRPMAAYASSEFSRVFSALDRDGDGKLSAAELRLCMKAALGEDVSAEEADRLVASADADGDGLLSQEELLALALAGTAEEEEERWRGLREAFGMYAMEGEGCITPFSLKRMLSRLGSHQDIDECRAMICRFDLDGDGVLSFEEFKVMMDA